MAVAATPKLVPVDREGRTLPIDPAVHMLDLPIVSRPGSDRRVVSVLAELLEARPVVFGTISEARVTSTGERLMVLSDRMLWVAIPGL